MRSGEGVFRRKPVVDRQYPAARARRQPAADHVMAVEVAKDKAAEEARRATASAKELGRKLFGRGKGKDENGK